MLRAGLAVVIVAMGWASQYAPGKMEAVIRVRQAGRTAYTLPAVLPAVDGYAAVLACERIGEVLYVQHAGVVESFLVVDCAGDEETRQWMARNNILLEVDYETAIRWNTVGRGAQVAVVDVALPHRMD